MPRASAGPVTVPHYWPEHQDGYYTVQNPPVVNVWYTVIDEVDVDVMWLALRQNNGDAAAKNIEVRFTVDGVVYQTTFSVPHDADQYIYRQAYRSIDAIPGLAMGATLRNAGYTKGWKAQAFKFEVRITSPLGTDQAIRARAVADLDRGT